MQLEAKRQALDALSRGVERQGYDTKNDTNCPRLPGCKHSFPATPCPPLRAGGAARVPSGSGNFSLKSTCIWLLL